MNIHSHSDLAWGKPVENAHFPVENLPSTVEKKTLNVENYS
ncbi:hypothetical protein Pse7367_1463 [Thalassoporum mexicanum PCC 7367]|nr:hypothetical protein Pse7367_1463 [Pseudanabaena sp. PCC 7367]